MQQLRPNRRSSPVSHSSSPEGRTRNFYPQRQIQTVLCGRQIQQETDGNHRPPTTQRRQNIFKALLEGKRLSHHELAMHVSISSQGLTWQMNRLRETGLIAETRNGLTVTYACSKPLCPLWLALLPRSTGDFLGIIFLLFAWSVVFWLLSIPHLCEFFLVSLGICEKYYIIGHDK
jgi:hypothetical protein